ncbi:MAG: DUF1045 domain-containing protein [Alphaproteobacteria bacterium]|nr:DUF1045 domain-containing protein [Alphaproteobacteria bacterium]
MAPRYAVYFAPAPETALGAFGAGWLGGAPASVAGIPAGRLLAITAAPRRYGFHATIKAPFRLHPETSESDLRAGLEALCADLRPVPLGRLRLSEIDGFLALVPAAPPRALARLERAAVTRLDAARAPLDEEDRARRARARLSPRQVRLFARWGYPYVLEEFRFHMTLTERLAAQDERARVAAALTERLVSLLEAPIVLDALALLVEEEPAAPFRVLARVPLSGTSRM